MTFDDIKPEEWLAEDEKAAKDAWDEVMSQVPNLEKMSEEAREAMHNIFEIGFTMGTHHQVSRLKAILDVLKEMMRRATIGKEDAHERDGAA